MIAFSFYRARLLPDTFTRWGQLSIFGAHLPLFLPKEKTCKIRDGSGIHASIRLKCR